MRLSVSEAAKRAVVSVRTLRYYDETGLLKPSEAPLPGNGFTTARLWRLCSRSCFTVSRTRRWSRSGAS